MRFRPLLAASLAALVTLTTPSEARAHGHLVRSRPSAGDTLHAVPRLLHLEFNEAPELAMSSLRLLDVRRREIALASLRTPGDSLRVMVADIAGPLAPGRYTVQWEMTGKDGHPVRGQYVFVIAADAEGLVAAPAVQGGLSGPDPAAVAAASVPAPMAPPTDASFDAGSPVYVVVRWMHFAGLLVVIGAMAFHYLVLPAAAREPANAPLSSVADERARRLAVGAALLVALSVMARLFAQWAVMRAAGAADTPAPVLMSRIMWETSWGRAWRLEIVALAVLGVALFVARVHVRSRAGWAIATVATLALGFVPALSGHAAANGAIIAIAADALHVLVAGGWMGGLFVLLLAGLPAASAVPAPRRAAAMAALVNAFSVTALVFATTLVLTGLLATWRNVESVSALVSSTYGRVLLLKLATLGVAALTGLYNWRRARPALAVTGDDRRIRAAMRVELAAGVVILVLTAILVAIPPPADLPMR